MPVIRIADYEAFRLLLLREMLATDSSLSFIEAKDGKQAQYPDLIILELLMPGMSGLDVFRLLKADLKVKATLLILITASTGT